MQRTEVLKLTFIRNIVIMLFDELSDLKLVEVSSLYIY